MQRKIIKEVSEIIAGFTFRGALKSDPDGGMRVLLAKNINEDGTISYDDLTKISLEAPRTNAFVSKNDVVLSSRGVFRAGVFSEDTNNTITASSVYILRISVKYILPKYLAIYLNSKIGQNRIKNITTGSTVKTILRGALENLEINIPSIDRQKKIIEIMENWQTREKMLVKKIEVSKNITEGAITHLLTN